MSAGFAIPEDTATAAPGVSPELPDDAPLSAFPFQTSHFELPTSHFPPILPHERFLIEAGHGGDTGAFEERREFLAENMCQGDRPGLLTTYIHIFLVAELKLERADLRFAQIEAAGDPAAIRDERNWVKSLAEARDRALRNLEHFETAYFRRLNDGRRLDQGSRREDHRREVFAFRVRTYLDNERNRSQSRRRGPDPTDPGYAPSGPNDDAELPPPRPRTKSAPSPADRQPPTVGQAPAPDDTPLTDAEIEEFDLGAAVFLRNGVSPAKIAALRARALSNNRDAAGNPLFSAELPPHLASIVAAPPAAPDPGSLTNHESRATSHFPSTDHKPLTPGRNPAPFPSELSAMARDILADAKIISDTTPEGSTPPGIPELIAAMARFNPASGAADPQLTSPEPDPSPPPTSAKPRAP